MFNKIQHMIKISLGRLHYVYGWCRLRGAFKSYTEAIDAIPSHRLAGYNNDALTEISYEKMCRVMPWDYPVMFWLYRLLPKARLLIDAGGHMGTKYRAFRPYLPLHNVEWTVYDVPAIVKAGKKKAKEDGLTDLFFIEDLHKSLSPDIFLASGLLQYLDIPFPALLNQLPSLPPHLIINKVALRKGDTIVSLENFGKAFVPYQIRSNELFLSELFQIGYQIKDEWDIPSLSNSITTHPELGAYQSKGFYMTRK
jgi:putative methyltransferase (TIGR04325 family)